MLAKRAAVLDKLSDLQIDFTCTELAEFGELFRQLDPELTAAVCHLIDHEAIVRARDALTLLAEATKPRPTL